MKLNSLSVFLTVVEEMNFTKAAERLYMTQQSVSGHIARLEAGYGVTLFTRKPVLRLTPEGKAMAHFAEILINTESNMLADFADINENNYGEIILGISHLRSQVFFSKIWSIYHPIHPNIAITLYERNTPYLLEALNQGQLDLIIGFNIPKTPNLETQVLTRENVCAIVHEAILKKYYPSDYRNIIKRSKEQGMSIAILKRLPLIMLPKSSSIRLKVDELFIKERALPRIILETNNHQVIIKAAFNGDGVGLVTPVGLYGNGINPISPVISDSFLPKGCHLFNLKGEEGITISMAHRKDQPFKNYALDLKDVIVSEFNAYNRFLSKMY